ncbi:MAG: hypothetical protein ACO4B4_11020 [Planctomycetota bacterium]
MSDPRPSTPEEIRLLHARPEEEGLEPAEAERLARALAADPLLSEELLVPLPGEEHLGALAVEPPGELEWARVDRGIEEALRAPTSAAPPRGSLAPGFLLAAAVVLCALVVRLILTEGLAPPQPSPVVEVLDLREDAESLILFPEGDEDGGVIIFVTST